MRRRRQKSPKRLKLEILATQKHFHATYKHVQKVGLIGYGGLPNTTAGDSTVFHVIIAGSVVGIGAGAEMMHSTAGELLNSLTMFLLGMATN